MLRIRMVVCTRGYRRRISKYPPTSSLTQTRTHPHPSTISLPTHHHHPYPPLTTAANNPSPPASCWNICVPLTPSHPLPTTYHHHRHNFVIYSQLLHTLHHTIIPPPSNTLSPPPSPPLTTTTTKQPIIPRIVLEYMRSSNTTETLHLPISHDRAREMSSQYLMVVHYSFHPSQHCT